MAENRANNVYDESFEYSRIIQNVFKKMTEDLRRSTEQFQETRKEILSAMFLTVLEALFLNLFSSSLVDYLKTNSLTSFYGLPFFGFLSVVVFVIWLHYFKSFKPLYGPKVLERIHLAELPDRITQNTLTKIRENKVQVDEKKLCRDLFNILNSNKTIEPNFPLELKEEENLLRWTISSKPKVTFDISFMSLPSFYNDFRKWHTHDIQLSFRVSIGEPDNPRAGEILASLSGHLYYICTNVIYIMETYILPSYLNASTANKK
jgi:hypothetical protein